MANVNFEYRSTKTPANLSLRFSYKVNEEDKYHISIRAQIDDPKSRCNIEKSFWQDCKAGRNFRDTDKANRKTELEAEFKSLEKHVLTASMGRRSFATNYYGKVPTAYIKTITGHATEAMLLKYIGKADPGAEQDIYKAFTALK